MPVSFRFCLVLLVMFDLKHFFPPLMEQGCHKIIVTITKLHQKNIIFCTSYTLRKTPFSPPRSQSPFSLPPAESIFHYHPPQHHTLCHTLDRRNDNEMTCPHHIDQRSFQRLVSVSSLPPTKPADSGTRFPG